VGISALTDEQRVFAEENHRLIYSFLRKYHLPYEEWYGVAAIGFCRAVTRFEPERGALSSFAYSVMLNDVREVMRRAKKSIPVVSLQSELPGSDGMTLEDKLTNESCFMEPFFQDGVKKFLRSLKPIQRQIVALCAAGGTQKEIAVKVGRSQSSVARHIMKLKDRFREFQQAVN